MARGPAQRIGNHPGQRRPGQADTAIPAVLPAAATAMPRRFP